MIIGFTDVRRGFVGCMDDVSISRVSVPLYRSDSSVVATLIRFHNVNFNCDPDTVSIRDNQDPYRQILSVLGKLLRPQPFKMQLPPLCSYSSLAALELSWPWFYLFNGRS